MGGGGKLDASLHISTIVDDILIFDHTNMPAETTVIAFKIAIEYKRLFVFFRVNKTCKRTILLATIYHNNHLFES